MSITLEQVASTLNELKCRTNFNIKNVTEYMLPELKSRFIYMLKVKPHY